MQLLGCCSVALEMVIDVAMVGHMVARIVWSCRTILVHGASQHARSQFSLRRKHSDPRVILIADSAEHEIMTYGCQQYDPQRLCRYDRRAIDRRCDGCQRTTDRAYLESMSLWIHGISHIEKSCSHNGEQKSCK